MEAFEVLDISGDVGLKISGKNLSHLFMNASKGLYSLITSTNSIHPTQSLTIHATGDILESLLVAFLNELIYYFDTDGFIGKNIKIEQINENSVKAVLSGEPFDPERHERGLLLKAATYHNLKIEKMKGIWTASVVFDI